MRDGIAFDDLVGKLTVLLVDCDRWSTPAACRCLSGLDPELNRISEGNNGLSAERLHATCPFMWASLRFSGGVQWGAFCR
jgi:hypothetical protein